MSLRLRSVALLALASVALHQFRYWIAYGHDASAALAAEGHAYLAALVPFAAVLTGAALLDFVFAYVARRAGEPGRRARWLGVTVTLLAIYVCQESVEGLLASGHPGGLGAAFAGGGWVAVPLAAALGAVVTLALRGAQAALARRGRTPAPRRQKPPEPAPRPRSVALPLVGLLAGHRAGRGPPAGALA